MNFAGLTLTKLNENSVVKDFDCGDSDLNDFLYSKAKYFQEELLAVTYLLEDRERTIAFFSLFNDSLRVEEKQFASKSALTRWLKNTVSHPKRHLKNFPALKIGRLGVCSNIQQGGLGRTIINFIIDLAITHNEAAACKLITVDAYDQSLAFYEKVGFNYLTEMDASEDTRQMYLDLTPIINAKKENQ